MLAALFGAKKAGAGPPARARVEVVVEATRPTVPARQSSSLRRQDSKGLGAGGRGLKGRQLTRKLTMQKLEAEKASVRQFYSAEAERLRVNMGNNMAQMKQEFADLSHTIIDFKEHAAHLEAGTSDAAGAASLLHTYNEEMEGDSKLRERAYHWSRTVNTLLDKALDKKKKSSSLELYDYLSDVLGRAEPDCKPNAVAVVVWHPNDNTMLKVVHGTDSTALQPGKTMELLREGKAANIMPAVWRVMNSGEASLENPHGLERDAKSGCSVCPLKTTVGNTFGVVVSGPPALPDPLLDSLCRQAGPLIECTWKREKAYHAVLMVSEFIQKAASFSKHLVHVTFEEDAEGRVRPPGSDGDVWNWQPLLNVAKGLQVFELPLRWKYGESIGVMRMDMGTFTNADDTLISLFMVMSAVLRDAITEIEGLTPGDPPPLATKALVLSAYEAMRVRTPELIQKEISAQMKIFDATKVFSEISNYPKEAIDKDLTAVLNGVLCLVGHERKDLKEWPKIKAALKKPSLHEAMINVFEQDNWEAGQSESTMATKGVDLDAALDHISQAAVLLLRWLQAIRFKDAMQTAIDSESRPMPPDPVADGVFDEIDTSKDDFIDPKELVTYMVQHYTNKCAHTLMKVLDSDADKKISRDEWRRGWADGQISQILVMEAQKAKAAKEAEAGTEEPDPNAPRMRQRRGTMPPVMAMTAQAAAQSIDPKRLAELMGEAPAKPKKKTNTKDVKKGKK